MKQTIENYGACLNLTLFGKPFEVAQEVNKLYNFGVISNIPENYDEKTDSSVMVRSDEGRMTRGFLALAMFVMEQNPMLCRFLKGKLPKARRADAFKKRAAQLAKNYRAAFVKVDTVRGHKVADHIFTQGLIQDFDPLENDAWHSVRSAKV